jgi:hypothetical protein
MIETSSQSGAPLPSKDVMNHIHSPIILPTMKLLVTKAIIVIVIMVKAAQARATWKNDTSAM